MKVTRDTDYKDYEPYEPYVSDDDRQHIKDAAVADMLGDNGFYAMKVGTLLDGMAGVFDGLWKDGGRTVFDVYRCAAFVDWLKEFVGAVEMFSVKPTAAEKAASAGCVPMTFPESVMVFCRSYFGLRSFDEAMELTVGDYLLAKKDDYNKTTVERNSAKRTTNKN